MKYKSIAQWVIILAGMMFVIGSSLEACTPRKQQREPAFTTLPEITATLAQIENLPTPSTSPVPVSTHSDPTTNANTPTPMENEPVTIQLIEDEIVLTNNTSTLIYYEAFQQEILAVIEWAPCTDPVTCLEKRVEPGQAEHIGLESIVGVNTEVVTIFWWHLAKNPDDKGYHTTDLTFVDIRIR